MPAPLTKESDMNPTGMIATHLAGKIILPESPGRARAISVLILEDSVLDAELMVRELRRGGFQPEWRRVETEGDYAAQLVPSLDVILADYRLPGFEVTRALEILQEKGLEVPFIVVSGSVGEEGALEIIKKGANDYLLKDRLARLGLAVSHELEKKRLRDQLRQSQKMEAIGRLAGGVAHDFNNILTVIRGYAQILLTEDQDETERREQLIEILKATERAGGLTRQLLTFGRKQMVQLKTLDLNQVVTGLAKMLQRIIGDDLALILECSKGALPVYGDAGMLEQVVLNLAVNAREAMSQGGRLVIATSKMTTGELGLEAGTAPAELVMLQVTDTGCGMTPEVMAHAFEPFFTTKGPGDGTGLGLATVYSIVEQHQGCIEVQSKLGEGTRFRVFLPRATDDSKLEREESFGAKARGGKETILLVEDEPGIKNLVAIILRRRAYRIHEASSGVEGLEMWKKHAGEIDLLITDIVMPDGMTGVQLAEELKRFKPGLKVIYTSGHCVDSIDADMVLEEGVNFLQKPYLPEKLVEAVRRCLDA